jgi:hypothetical protein
MKKLQILKAFIKNPIVSNTKTRLFTNSCLHKIPIKNVWYDDENYHLHEDKHNLLSLTKKYSKILEELKDTHMTTYSYEYDMMIKECLEIGDEEILRFLCKTISQKITPLAFIHMKMKIPMLCEYVLYLHPDFILYLPRNKQTHSLCKIVIEKSFGKYFNCIHPNSQTYQFAISEVSYDGLNLGYVRKDLIDENMINTALNSNGMAIKYVSNPTEMQWITAINKSPQCIQYLETKDDKLINLAISKNPMAKQYVPNFEKM